MGTLVRFYTPKNAPIKNLRAELMIASGELDLEKINQLYRIRDIQTEDYQDKD